MMRTLCSMVGGMREFGVFEASWEGLYSLLGMGLWGIDRLFFFLEVHHYRIRRGTDLRSVLARYPRTLSGELSSMGAWAVGELGPGF